MADNLQICIWIVLSIYCISTRMACFASTPWCCAEYRVQSKQWKAAMVHQRNVYCIGYINDRKTQMTSNFFGWVLSVLLVQPAWFFVNTCCLLFHEKGTLYSLKLDWTVILIPSNLSYHKKQLFLYQSLGVLQLENLENCPQLALSQKSETLQRSRSLIDHSFW